MEQGKQQALTCVHGQPPFCTAGCPFELDVRNFAARLSRGRIDAAYRIFRDAVAFPGIVSQICPAPCQHECIRNRTDQTIRLHALERAVVTHAANTSTSRYSLPKKENRVAIVGAGISGLACALRLSSLKYEVTLYEKSERVGGHLLGIVPEDILQKDIQTQFQSVEYTLRPNAEIKSLCELDADMIYLATGKDGCTFGLPITKDAQLAQPKPNVLVGGSITGADSIHALVHGLKAAEAIDAYFKTGSLSLPKKKKDGTCLCVDEAKLKSIPAVQAAGDVYTQAEMTAEAQRCLQCDCDVCQRTCDLMGYYGKYPGRIVDEVDGTVHPAAIFANRMATRLIGSCTKCGICVETCPKHIDMMTFLLESRREMERLGDFPKVWSAFWLEDMAHANGEQAALVALPEGIDSATYAFFPGCQLGASDPRYVTKTYRALLQDHPDTGLILHCCGAPAYWAGQEDLHKRTLDSIKDAWQTLGKPTVLLACPSCRKLLNQFLPEIQTEFVYAMLHPENANTARTETVAVFDPCSSRHDPEVQNSVRSLVAQSGYCLSSLPNERENAQCCGYGGQTMIANPTKSAQAIKRNIAQSDLPFVTYCTNCRDTFAAQGKRSLHVLDAVFGLDDGSRKPPTWTKRRENRQALKRELFAQFGREEPQSPQKSTSVSIGDALMEKMQQNYTLREDIEQAVAYCEDTGNKLSDPASGHCLGHLMLGSMTLWVEYRALGSGYELINTYAHRMSIQESENKAVR